MEVDASSLRGDLALKIPTVDGAENACDLK